MNDIIRKPAPPLPATKEDFLSQRKFQAQDNLNDQVEEIVKILWDNDPYKALIMAVWDSEAVEGSQAADNYMAAELIRKTATIRDKNHPITKKNLATIAKAHGVVLRRYGLDRKTRRQTVNGEIVPTGDSNSEG